MPSLPWSTARPAAPDTVAVVMASRFRLQRLRDVPRFLADSLAIRWQVLAADGALGVALVARPLRREFLTLSAWRDRGAVDGLVRAQPHAAAMRRHRPAMAESTFVFFDVAAADLPPRWDDARRRLDDQRAGASRG